jgi:hypothetical protein
LFPSPITASTVAGVRKLAIRRNSENAGLGGGDFDPSLLSKRPKCDDAHNNVVAAAMLQQAVNRVAEAVINQVILIKLKFNVK